MSNRSNRARGGPGGPGGRGQGGPGQGGPGGRGRGGGSGAGRGGHAGAVIYAENRPAVIPDSLSKSAHDQLIAGFKKIAITAERPLRPGYGTLGKEITLRANFFPVRLPKVPVYDYTVSIAPKSDVNRIKGRLFKLVELTPAFAAYANFVAHDGNDRLVSAKELPQPLELTVPFVEEDEETARQGATVYVITFTFTRKLDPAKLTEYANGQGQFVDYDPLPLTSALNLVLQKHASNTGVRVGKSRYFFPSAERKQLDAGVVAWQGFYSSVRPVFKQLMVNVNVCMTAFYEPGNLAEALKYFNYRSHGGMLSLPKEFTFSLKVKTKHLGYKKKLFAIHNKNAQDTKFSCAELGGTVSVEQYFLKKYNLKLKYAKDLPVVNVGNAKKPNFIPAELCEIYDSQPFLGKLSPKMTENMIQIACNIPIVNATAIVEKGFPALGFMPPARSPLAEFGITVEAEMTTIPGRELPPPRVEYKSGTPNVNSGSWNILEVKFQRAGEVKSWWTLIIRDPCFGNNALSGPQDPRLVGLVQAFADKMRRSGMSVPTGPPRSFATPVLKHPKEDPGRTGAIGQIRDTIKQALSQAKDQKPSFILVLLNGVDHFIYPGIKRLGDVEFGIQTVHMQLSKATNERKQDQYLSNVALKVNAKMGGVNHMLNAGDMKWLRTKKTMIVGMDVTHPGPGSRKGTPSIAAVVASVDDNFVQYPASLRLQESKQEMIDGLSDMVVERLQLYKKKNSNQLPQRILFYRDGVSEGQFDIVLEKELPSVLQACVKINGGKSPEYRPSISVIICGKRHHARLYPTDSKFADKNGNTRPGTVVDKGITVASEFDFYLQAHAGLQGTVKSTHYSIIYDENAFDADTIQQGTHTMSYHYARATKAVSLVPAAYYADLACERGRYYINDFLSAEDKSTGTSVKSGSKREKEEEEKRVFAAAAKMWGEGLHPALRDTMFYI